MMIERRERQHENIRASWPNTLFSSLYNLSIREGRITKHEDNDSQSFEAVFFFSISRQRRFQLTFQLNASPIVILAPFLSPRGRGGRAPSFVELTTGTTEELATRENEAAAFSRL